MITWAFAYMIVNGVAVSWWAFVASIIADLFMVQMITEAIGVPRAIKALGPPIPDRPGSNIEPIKPREKP